jgi:N4-gp56 family major capsid protein
MSIARFRPEIWSANLLVALRKSLVYGSPMVVNKDYEGEIAEFGDTVRITSISRPAIGTYVPNSTTITFPELTDAQRTLVIDQAKYWSFSVDDVDARQARGNVMPQAADEAAFALADVIDQYIASFYTGVQSANQLGSITVNSATTPTDAYDKVLVPLKIKLDKANVPTNGRYVVVTPELHGCLLRDSRFIKVNEAGTDEGLRNGHVGRASGFDIMISNNTPNTSGSEFVIQGGTNQAISFAEQINKVEALRPQSSFSDALKGLALYGAKLVRPDALATALVTVS